MEELSSVEILEKYSLRHGYEFMTSSDYEKHNLFPLDPVLNTKYCVSKVRSGNETFYLCQHDYFATRTGMRNTYCGLFKSSNHPVEFQITVRDWMDNLTLHRHQKTGSPFIDKNLVISSAENVYDRYLTIKSAEEIISLSKQVAPIKMISAESYIHYVPELKKGYIIGIVTNNWLTDDHLLDLFIEKGTRILLTI
ncbi:MAG: hypothetical protein WCK34_12810 [Bacteroidota bacterium]